MFVLDDFVRWSSTMSERRLILGGSIEEERAVCDSRPKRSRSGFQTFGREVGGRRELGTPQIKGEE
jgi:hypothetical protein